ncbi:hypothetical protein BDZ91DRAFT_650310 [Kalaharituber pfeilii]|nr:hypothetical protein BDZ91DRAFT_650310 [Kalaharituber pfeilii]
MVHETSTPAIVHETTTSVKYEQPKPEHTPPPKYELDVQPPAEGPKTHTVTVGGDAGLVYTPEHVIAAVGDIVHFVFQKQNHSVTQSTFDLPCNRLETGEDSGLLPNPNNTVVPAPTWEYVVKDQAPTWWYCKQRTGTHCGKGMVFAINPTAEKTFATFKEKAIKLNGTEAVTTTAPAPEKTVTDVATTVTLINDDPKPTETNVPVKDKPYMAPGWNQNGNPSACNCACFCGIGSFPQGDGWGHYGGFGGSMAAPW